MALIEFKDLPNTTTPLNAENLNNNFNELDTKINTSTNNVSNKIGDLTQLETTDKTNLVNAINGVVESGSNSNGKYVKFADGTMICNNYIEHSGLNFSDAWGSVYSTPNPFNLGNFAQPFIEKPNMTVISTGPSTSICTGIKDTTSTKAGVVYIVRPKVDNNLTCGYSYIAIGRWK